MVFSEILPVEPLQKSSRKLGNFKWLRNWCRMEGFGFLENWVGFSVSYPIYSRDGLHINGEGAALLWERMAKKFKELLN